MIRKKSPLLLQAAIVMLSAAIYSVSASAGPPQNQAMDNNVRLESAIFAGGCFWCVESDFDKVPGVVETISGYTDGHLTNPTYKQVTSGKTGHTEAVKITFDSDQVSYEKLLEIFWRSIDPTTVDRQFCDRGNQYRSGIYYQDVQQMELANRSRSALEKNKPFKEAIVTEIKAATTFYPAEEYHQDFHNKNPIRYSFYRRGCGRDSRLKTLWGDQIS